MSDSWYLKAAAAGLINEFGNLDIITMPASTLPCMNFPLPLPGSADVPGNMESASTWKILSCRYPKAVTGR